MKVFEFHLYSNDELLLEWIERHFDLDVGAANLSKSESFDKILDWASTRKGTRPFKVQDGEDVGVPRKPDRDGKLTVMLG